MQGYLTLTILGRLTHKPILRKGANSDDVYCYFQLAVNYPGFHDKDGNVVPGRTEFVQLSAKKDSARFLCEHGEKGDLVFCEADMRSTTNTIEKDGVTKVYKDYVFPVRSKSLQLNWESSKTEKSDKDSTGTPSEGPAEASKASGVYTTPPSSNTAPSSQAQPTGDTQNSAVRPQSSGVYTPPSSTAPSSQNEDSAPLTPEEQEAWEKSGFPF